MKYKGKELKEFKSDTNDAFNHPREMLVWDDCDNEPAKKSVVAILSSLRYPVITLSGNCYTHCAEISKITNWDVYQERYGADKLPLKDAIDLIERHGMFCRFCPARKFCASTRIAYSCTETFKTWAEAEAEDD